MAEYIVVSDTVGVTGDVEVRESPTRRPTALAATRYYRKGETVELDDERAAKLVEKGHIKPVGEVEASTLVADAPAPDVAPNEPVDAPEVDPETGEADLDESEAGDELTPKQKLQAEARRLGVDDSGTMAEIQARIDEKKAEG